MNAHQESIDIQVCGNQVTEAVSSIFHTILLNRSVGKFSFNDDGSKSVGTVGYRDVDCNFVDLTYVACSSDVLDEHIRAPIREFSEQLRSCDATSSKPNGQISLQFYQKRKSRWKSTAAVPWEIWNLDVELITLNNQSEIERNREEISQVLSEKLLIVIEALDRHIYFPDNAKLLGRGEALDCAKFRRGKKKKLKRPEMGETPGTNVGQEAESRVARRPRGDLATPSSAEGPSKKARSGIHVGHED